MGYVPSGHLFSQLLLEGHVLTAAEYASMDEADVEDLLGRAGYIALVEKCYGLKTKLAVAKGAGRVVKDVEEINAPQQQRQLFVTQHDFLRSAVSLWPTKSSAV